MKKIITAICLLWSSTALAQTAQEVKEVEDYLNNIKTMEARFVQSASNGAMAEGKLYIAKPNKIRMEYDAPLSVMIIGDGDYIVYNDKELDQVTHIDYDDIPATLILGNNIKIDGDEVKITGFYKDAGTTTITLQHKNNDIGPITLTFTNDPMELKQWKIVDPQSVEVTVSLYDIKSDEELSKDLFKFKDNKKSPMNYRGRK